MTDRREYHRLYKRRQRAMQRLGLKVVKPTEHDALVMDSRQVAEMVGKGHAHLMRDIRGYVKVIDHNPDLDSADFFIESTYKNSNNQSYKSYLLTKQGCEMVGNKMTGEKGILFTATYVSRFNEMEKILGQQKSAKIDTAESVIKELEIHLKAARLSADMLGVDRAELIRMLIAVHDHHGIPTSHLLAQKIGGEDF